MEELYGLGGEEAIKYRECAELHGLSRERIRQLDVRALGRLRDALEEPEP